MITEHFANDPFGMAKLANASPQLESLQQSSSGDAGELTEAIGKVGELERKLAGAEEEAAAAASVV